MVINNYLFNILLINLKIHIGMKIIHLGYRSYNLGYI